MASAGNYLADDIYLVTDRTKMPGVYQFGRPFFPLSGLCVLILEGRSEYVVNMIPYHMIPGDVLMVPENSIMEITSVSPDVKIILFSYYNLHMREAASVHKLHLDDSELLHRHMLYFQLMYSIASSGNRHSLSKIQAACIEDLLKVEKIQNENEDRKINRGRMILKDFFGLLEKHAETDRSIEFYADKLCLTPNWLSNVVKANSGHTVLYWINKAVIQRAKLALIYSDDTIYSIADDLNFVSESVFSRFFKRETGLTPKQYRNSQSH